MDRKWLLAGALTLLLSGCAAVQQALAPPSPVVSNSVAAAEIALTDAERLALVYTKLPRCPAAAVCSNPATVAKIKDLDNQAYAAVVAARTNSALIGGALQLIAALQAAVPHQ